MTKNGAKAAPGGPGRVGYAGLYNQRLSILDTYFVGRVHRKRARKEYGFFIFNCQCYSCKKNALLYYSGATAAKLHKENAKRLADPSRMTIAERRAGKRINK